MEIRGASQSGGPDLPLDVGLGKGILEEGSRNQGLTLGWVLSESRGKFYD